MITAHDGKVGVIPSNMQLISCHLIEFIFYCMDSFQLLLRVQKVKRCLCLQEASKPENRAQRPWIITMAHRPMYCSNAVGDGCENHENAVSNSSDILLFEQLPVILIDLLVPSSNLLNLHFSLNQKHK